MLNDPTEQQISSSINSSTQGFNSGSTKHEDVLNTAYQHEDGSLLMDQYKLYVEMHDKISERRGTTNSFYISLLSAALAFISVMGNEKAFPQSKSLNFSLIIIATSILGIALCFLWYFSIRGYALLVKRKIEVILEMEKYLPFYAYSRENSLWSQEKKRESHILRPIRISTFEQAIPISFGCVFFILLIYSLANLWK